MHSGSCLCGGIQFDIDGELAPIQVCHCQQCRKAQGGPFATNIPVLARHFHLRSGAEFLQEYESSAGKKRVFCKRCGSPIFSRRDELPEMLRIRAGIINGELKIKPVVHAYMAHKADWWDVRDDLPTFADASVASVLKG